MKNQLIYKLITLCVISLASCKKETALQEKSANDLSASKNMSLTTSAAVESYQKGVSGHALGSSIEYDQLSMSQQIAAVKRVNATYYRTDILTDTSGVAAKEQKLHDLIAAARTQGVKVLPVIYLRGYSSSLTTSAAYTKGKNLGRGFASRYPGYFNFYEIGNEEEVKSLFDGQDGQDTSDYRTSVFVVQAAFFRGMSEGIKEVHPEAKIMINGGWLHYGFIRRLLNNNVKIDRIGWHWYSNQETLAPQSPYNIADIGDKLHELFPTIPIWFTEMNRKDGSRSAEGTSTLEAEQQQADFITTFGNKQKNKEYIKVMIAYEMFDQLDRSDTSLEKYYGIFKWTTPYTTFTEKLGATAFKNL